MKRKRFKASAIPLTDWRSVLKVAVLLAALLAILAVLAIPASAKNVETFPPVFNVPNGWQPEGIAVGRGSSFYVGSLLHGGVYGGDLRTGEGDVVVPPQEGRISVGLAVDTRSNAIFVAGGGPLLGPIDAAVHVYDAGTGAELAAYLLDDGVFVNDVVVTREAAYFTDSGRPLLYKVPLGPGGELPDPFEVEEVPLGPGFDFDPMQFVNANGIVATPDGKSLIIVNTGLASLYKFDLQSGETTKIDLGGGSVMNGDGLVLAGKTLYVVQNFLNQIGVVDLDPSFTSGIVRDEALTSPDFIIPTTAARFGSTIYAVNARFGDFTPGVPSPDLEFTVVGLPMR